MEYENKSWCIAALADLVSIKTGKLNSNAAVENGAYPFFTCSRETYKVDTYSFDCEAVLLAGNNANGVYPVKYYKGRFDAYQRTYVIRSADNCVLNNRYLFYALQLELDLLQSLSTGSATKFLTLTILNALKIRVPALSDQNRIVSILGAYDDLIENNTRRIEILEEMARRLYEEWFVQFRFPGYEGVGFKESELGLIPEGWVVSCLGDIAEEVREAVHPSNVSPDTPYIGLEHLPRRSITLREWGSADSVSSGKLFFRRGDVLFGKIRPYFHKVVIAPFSGICSSDTILIRPNKDSFLGLVLCCSSSDKFVDYATQTSNGTKMPRADWKVLKNYPVLIPSDRLLSDFNSLILGVVNQARNLMLKNVNLRAQRDLLLPKLISGEIDVSDIPMPT